MVSGKPMFYRGTARKHTTDSEFDVSKLDKLPAVNVVYSYANATRTAIDAFAAAGDVGIVHAGTGNGSLSTPVKAAPDRSLQEGHDRGAQLAHRHRYHCPQWRSQR